MSRNWNAFLRSREKVDFGDLMAIEAEGGFDTNRIQFRLQ